MFHKKTNQLRSSKFKNQSNQKKMSGFSNQKMSSTSSFQAPMVAPSCLKPSKVARKKPTPAASFVGFGIQGSKSGDFVLGLSMNPLDLFEKPSQLKCGIFFRHLLGRNMENSALPLLVCSLCPVNMFALYTAFAIC